MRLIGSGKMTAFGERTAALAAGVAVALVITGCATQVAGTALPPTSIPSSSTTTTVASMPTGTPTSSDPSSDDTSLSGTSSSETSSSETSSSETAGSETATSDSSSQPSSSPPSTTASTTGGGATVQPAAFLAKLKAANAGVKSMKGSISVDAGEGNVSGTFVETVTGGQVDALDMSMYISEGSNRTSLRLLIVGGKIYLGGAAALKSLKVTKKWALASKDSKNANLRALAGQLAGYLTTTSAQQYELYAAAAKSVTDGGEERIGAVAAHRYVITVDVAELAKLSPAASRAALEALAQAGVKSIPTTLWLNSSNLLVQTTTTVKVSGVTSKSVLKVSAYNVPVTVKAPPADEVFTG